MHTSLCTDLPNEVVPDFCNGAVCVMPLTGAVLLCSGFRSLAGSGSVTLPRKS